MIPYLIELAFWMAVPFVAGCLGGAVLRLNWQARRRG